MWTKSGSGPQTDKTPAAKFLYRSILLDDDILHCLLWVLSFYGTPCPHTTHYPPSPLPPPKPKSVSWLLTEPICQSETTSIRKGLHPPLWHMSTCVRGVESRSFRTQVSVGSTKPRNIGPPEFAIRAAKQYRLIQNVLVCVLGPSKNIHLVTLSFQRTVAWDVSFQAF